MLLSCNARILVAMMRDASIGANITVFCVQSKIAMTVVRNAMPVCWCTVMGRDARLMVSFVRFSTFSCICCRVLETSFIQET